MAKPKNRSIREIRTVQNGRWAEYWAEGMSMGAAYEYVWLRDVQMLVRYHRREGFQLTPTVGLPKLSLTGISTGPDGHSWSNIDPTRRTAKGDWDYLKLRLGKKFVEEVMLEFRSWQAQDESTHPSQFQSAFDLDTPFPVKWEKGKKGDAVTRVAGMTCFPDRKWRGQKPKPGDHSVVRVSYTAQRVWFLIPAGPQPVSFEEIDERQKLRLVYGRDGVAKKTGEKQVQFEDGSNETVYPDWPVIPV